MAAKRLRDGSEEPEYDDEQDKLEQKKLRTVPSFSTVIKEAMLMRSMQNLFGGLEPLLRKVVQEEVERILVRSTLLIQSSPPVQIEEVESSSLRLAFHSPPSLPIFTGSKIVDLENKPLQIVLKNSANDSLVILPSSVKLQVVVLDGDFSSKGRENWTSAEFERAIVKERTGKRPLLAGEFPVILKNGVASIGELIFTDNSCWVRSQHFSIGVRVDPDQGYKGPKIQEVMTGAFRVKDHRGELYKKHYPPALGDDVWRLKKIGKDGAFHRRLSKQGIKTVHDFLKLLTVNPALLREILGAGMSDKVWEITVNHAKTCQIGDRVFVHCKQPYTILLNNVCDLIDIAINGVTVSFQQLNRPEKDYVLEMIQEAFLNFDRLQESDGLLYNPIVHQNIQSLPQGAIEGVNWYSTSEIQIEDYDDNEPNNGTMPWPHL